MSYAFEAAVRGYAITGEIFSGRRFDLASMIARAVEAAKAPKTPTWTVSKKDRRR